MFHSNMVCFHIHCLFCTKCNFPHLSFSEELLGLHETIQIYYKFKLVVPLRLLHVNNLKHHLARNVSQFKLLLCSHLQYRSFTKKEWLVFSLEMLLSQTPVPGSWPACYHQGYCSCKNLHPEFLTLFCLHITSWWHLAARMK